jgi:hypothetical protein
VTESFRTILASYEATHDLTPQDCAHLQRWSDDDRADEEWQTIDRAAHEHGLALPPNVFIREILAIKHVAEAISCRGRYRSLYRKRARQLQEIAKFLRTPHPAGMPPTFPRSEELAQMLDDAAEAHRKEVEPSREVAGVVRVTREADTPAIFMNQVSNYLKDITGRWLDEQVATLTEIAFEKVGDVDAEHVKCLRRNVRRRPAVDTADH